MLRYSTKENRKRENESAKETARDTNKESYSMPICLTWIEQKHSLSHPMSQMFAYNLSPSFVKETGNLAKTAVHGQKKYSNESMADC